VYKDKSGPHKKIVSLVPPLTQLRSPIVVSTRLSELVNDATIAPQASFAMVAQK